MLVNNKKWRYSDFDSAVEKFKSLPSGFSKRNRKSFDDESGELQTDEAADARLSEDAIFFDNYMNRTTGNNNNEIDELEALVSVYKKNGDLEPLSITIGKLHRVVLDVARENEDAGKTEQAEFLRQKLSSLRQYTLELLAGSKGELENDYAYRVEQGEIGFSADKPIGTDSVYNCICLMVHDPETHKTALAHIDAAANKASLQNIFDRMPSDRVLDVRIVGAQLTEGNGVTEYYAQASKDNIDKVLTFLDRKNVNVISATLLDPNQPTAIVVDPKTFKISEEIPNFPNSGALIANAKQLMVLDSYLCTSFDLTVSEERATALLDLDSVAFLRESFVGKTEDEVYQVIEEKYGFPDRQLPAAVEGVLQLIEAYTLSVNRITDCLDKKIARLETKGVTIKPQDRQSVIDAIGRYTMHVGENAYEANRPLADFIKKDLFKVKPNKEYNLNISGLKAISFSEQPYSIIEATKTPYNLYERLEKLQTNMLV